MNYYVIRVSPGKELVFQQQTAKQLDDPTVAVVYPRRKLFQTRKGKKKEVEVALFPGYVFLRVEVPLETALYERFKPLPGYLHFLKDEQGAAELSGRDLKLLGRFLKFGEIVPLSQVMFDENQRIRVLSGPMEGLDGQIIHVDRRKRRAKIRLDLTHGEFTVTLGFEVLEKTEPTGGA